MKLIRYNEPSTFYDDWDAFFADPFRAFAPLFRSTPSSYHRLTGNVEWYEDDNSYHARIEMPGVKRDDLHVDAEDGLIRLGFEHSEEAEQQETSEAHSERFEQVLRSPEGIDTGGIEARLADGILELTLPKAEERKPVSVQVN